MRYDAKHVIHMLVSICARLEGRVGLIRSRSPETFDAELGRIAAKHPGIFSCVDPENLDGFLHGLESELAAASRNGVNPIARRYAETNLNQDAILTRFRSDLELLVGGSIRTTSENG